MIVVSTRALMATLAIGVTLPSESIRTGIGLRSTVATSTGTTWTAPCERAATPSPVQKPRTSNDNANQGERRHPK